MIQCSLQVSTNTHFLPEIHAVVKRVNRHGDRSATDHQKATSDILQQKSKTHTKWTVGVNATNVLLSLLRWWQKEHYTFKVSQLLIVELLTAQCNFLVFLC